MGECGCRRPCCGTWTARSSTPSRTGSRREFALADEYGGTWTRARAQPGRQRPARLRPLHAPAHGHRPGARRDRRDAPRRVVARVERVGAVASRRAASCSRTCGAVGAVRPGHDVLPAVRGADPGHAARRPSSTSQAVGSVHQGLRRECRPPCINRSVCSNWSRPTSWGADPLPDSSVEQVIECGCRPGLGIVEQVRVGVQGDLPACVAQPLLDDLDPLSGLEEQGGVGVLKARAR